MANHGSQLILSAAVGLRGAFGIKQFLQFFIFHGSLILMR